jgi:hypothetical protein
MAYEQYEAVHRTKISPGLQYSLGNLTREMSLFQPS